MSPAAAIHERNRCRFHTLRRSIQLGVRLAPCDLVAIETELEKMRPAYERRGEVRYPIVVKRARGRLLAVYDTRLGCLVSVCPMPVETRVAGRGFRGGDFRETHG